MRLKMFLLLRKWREHKRTDRFLSLMVVAREDATIASRLLTILRQDEFNRHAMLRSWIHELKRESAPVSFTDAISCLLDDQIAARAEQLLKADDSIS